MKTFTESNRTASGNRRRFGGCTVLVVGGGQAGGPATDLLGNGRAICLALAAEGASVVCADRDLVAARQTVTDAQARGGRASALQADIGNPEEVLAMFAALADRGQQIDGLVLNAGISDRRRLADVTAQSWDHIFNANLRGHMLCAQAALRMMNAGGAIVFVSSLAALMPAGRNPAYESSKAALSALCRAVALEGHDRDIRANVVRAGLIDTPMGRAASAARPERAATALPFGRQGSAWDIANAVCFLLCADSAYVNAIELPVDGGLAHGIVRPLSLQETSR
jgi:NAD(P)-dependent dehydrogenase (short-subunit alcohol dehydrogenase family)